MTRYEIPPGGRDIVGYPHYEDGIGHPVDDEWLYPDQFFAKVRGQA